MDRPNQKDKGPRFQPMVVRLLEGAAQYVSNARLDDGLVINEVVFAEARQPGAASALHAKWQNEGHCDRLSRDECAELARAGFKINKDPDGFWAWWREKRLSHLWLAVGSDGWRCTNAPHPSGKWNTISSFYNPILPHFNDYHVTPHTVIRESLVAGLTNLKNDVPEKVFGDQFLIIVKRLCDEAVHNMILDEGWLDDILTRVPGIDPGQLILSSGELLG